jgi:Tfp pilus assembly PilM family ATPase
MSLFKHYQLGIYLTEKVLVLTEIDTSSKHIHLSNFGTIALPQNFEKQQTLKPLRQLIQKLGIHSTKTHLSIPSEKTIRKTISFNSRLTETDIETELHVHQTKYFPMIDSPLLFDFHKESSTATQTNLAVIATRKNTIENQARLLKKLGFKIITIEPDGYAILRALTQTKKITIPDKGKATAVIIIYCQTLRMICFNQHHILKDGKLTIDTALSQKSFDKTLLKKLQSITSETTIHQIFMLDLLEQPSEIYNDLKPLFPLPITRVNFFEKPASFLPPKLLISHYFAYLIALGLAIKENHDYY